jgi:hypothetical protein
VIGEESRQGQWSSLVHASKPAATLDAGEWEKVHLMSAQLDQIRSAYDRLALDWKTNEGAAVASAFVEDGALINPFGERSRSEATLFTRKAW